MGELVERGDSRIWLVEAAGEPLGSERDATDLIGDSSGQDTDLIAIPVDRLHRDFLILKTRMAGFFIQKLMNYGRRVAFVGDISAAVAASDALRDYVRECNRGQHVFFDPDLDALFARLDIKT